MLLRLRRRSYEEARFDELPMDEPTLELKTLPSKLKYAFLDENKAKAVIILSKLDIKQEEQLLEVLRNNRMDPDGLITCIYS